MLGTSMLTLSVAFAMLPTGQALAAHKATDHKATDSATKVLPRRPQPLTHAQFAALKRISDQPQHAAIRNMRATYRDKNTQIATDGGQVAFLAALGGGLLTVLIAAAPL